MKTKIGIRNIGFQILETLREVMKPLERPTHKSLLNFLHLRLPDASECTAGGLHLPIT